MLRAAVFALGLVPVACSSASFDVSSSTSFDTGAAAADTGAPPDDSASPPLDSSSPPLDSASPPLDSSSPPLDSMVISTDSGTPPPIDAGGPVADAACPAVVEATPDVYVDAAALPGGNGTIGCPFRTLAHAAAAPMNGTVVRVVHVKSGTYNESGGIKIRSRETYRGEAGIVKVVVPASAPVCSPASAGCVFNMQSGSTLDGFLIEGGGVAHGIVASGSTNVPPVVRNVTVKGMAKDGIVSYFPGLTMGPNAYSNGNGGSGLYTKAGKIFINEGPNGFNNNAANGIHMVAGAIFLDNVATASGNNVGVLFDRAGSSASEQVLSQIDITKNKTHGVVIGKGWAKVELRKVVANQNTLAGVWAEVDTTSPNTFDFGSSGPGNNQFGGMTNKNGKVGIFLCRAPSTFVANGNNWSSCPPLIIRAVDCETMPATYADYAYVPADPTSTTSTPLTASPCTSMF